jgi:hypothetical protein
VLAESEAADLMAGGRMLVTVISDGSGPAVQGSETEKTGHGRPMVIAMTTRFQILMSLDKMHGHDRAKEACHAGKQGRLVTIIDR